MDDREKQSLRKVFQDSLHYKYNEDSCTMDLDIEKTVDNLIANGVMVQQWIPVTERLPEDDLPKDSKRRMIRCLVATDKGTVKPCVRQRWEHFDGKLQPWMWNKDLYVTPTHWMYYPEPPKEE